MKTLFATGLIATLLTFTVGAASAMDSMDSMHSSMMMPKCASGDPLVGVNTVNKTYMTHDQMKMKMAGMSDSQMHGMMMKHHMTMMCMSKAKSMGASMMKPKM